MDNEEQAVELTTFTTTGDAYIYAPLPPATSYGHRAELWNPDKWLCEVKLKVLTAGDNCFVRMLTKDTGELFAECPLPADGTPLTTAVEPVVDSSRYFVVKVVDRESRNHAFIGVGFRDRMDASDFSAALDDYRQYLRRRQEAEVMRQEFDSTLQVSAAAAAAQAAGSGGSAEGADGAAAASSVVQKDFSLKPGETMHIKLSPSLKRGDSGSKGSILRTSSGNSSSSNPAGGAAVPAVVPRLAPPGSSSSSSSGFFRLQPPPPGAVGAVQQQRQPQGSSAAAPAMRRPSLEGGGVAGAGGAETSSAAAGAGASAGGAAAADDDDWGEFVG